MQPIRVMLVDDSLLFLGTLRSVVEKQPDMVVVGTASNGQEALEIIPGLRPNVVLCDVQMPKMSGIEFLQALLPRYPIPVIVISGTPGVTLSALQNGAVDFIQKPAGGQDRDKFFNRIIATIRVASVANVKAKMVLHPMGHSKLPPLLGAPNDAVIAIGASTGGTDAILEVVKELPANTPGIVVTQHMPAGFTAMYADRLAKECHMKVFEAKDGQRLTQGTILLAAGGFQMRLNKDAQGYYVTSRQGEKVSGHSPSVDVLFNSVAETAGRRAVGVILTGMGADGAAGLLKMRKAGAFTIGQDKESCVVYGMPMVAFGNGAVVKQLPLEQISGELLRYLNGMR